MSDTRQFGPNSNNHLPMNEASSQDSGIKINEIDLSTVIVMRTEEPRTPQINFDEIDLQAAIASEPKITTNQNDVQPVLLDANLENDNSSLPLTVKQKTRPGLEFREINSHMICATCKNEEEANKALYIVKYRFSSGAHTPVELRDLYNQHKIHIYFSESGPNLILMIGLDLDIPIPCGEKSLLHAVNNRLLYTPHMESLQCINFTPIGSNKLQYDCGTERRAKTLVARLKSEIKKAPPYLKALFDRQALRIFRKHHILYVKIDEPLPNGESLLDTINTTILQRLTQTTPNPSLQPTAPTHNFLNQTLVPITPFYTSGSTPLLFQQPAEMNTSQTVNNSPIGKREKRIGNYLI